MEEKVRRGGRRIGPSVTFRLPDECREWVDREAARTDRPMSRIVRELVMAGIAAREAKAAGRKR